MCGVCICVVCCGVYMCGVLWCVCVYVCGVLWCVCMCGTGLTFPSIRTVSEVTLTCTTVAATGPVFWPSLAQM